MIVYLRVGPIAGGVADQSSPGVVQDKQVPPCVGLEPLFQFAFDCTQNLVSFGGHAQLLSDGGHQSQLAQIFPGPVGIRSSDLLGGDGLHPGLHLSRV